MRLPRCMASMQATWARAISRVQRGCAAVPFTTSTIKGITYAVFPVAQGTYHATFTGSVPTGPATPPVVLGHPVVGATQDNGDANFMNGTRFQMGQLNEAASAVSVYVGDVNAAPNDQFQVAIYTDVNGDPGTLLVQSGTGALIANAWNTIAIPTTVLAGGTHYWLMFNTNGSQVNMWYDPADLLGTRPAP